MKKRLALLLFSLTLLLTVSTGAARADGIIIPEPPCDPCPGPVPLQQLEIRSHRVDVTITDQVAVTRVDQVFRNPNDYTIEGVYIFPLPQDAVVTGFKLWIDGQPVEGRVLEAGEARAVYQEIVRQMIDPALLEYLGQGLFQASIFPIEPGQERRIQLEYSQVLAAENGLVRYTYPLNTEKFSLTPLEQVAINVDVQSATPIRAMYSPTHNIAVSRDSPNRYRAGYEAANLKPNSDFVLYYSIGQSQALHLLTYRNPADPTDPDGFYLLLLAPRPDADTKPVPKDVILVLDRSGSMDGEKYRQAQQAARFILERLGAQDRFNIVRFSTDIQTFAPEIQPASAADKAIRWIENDLPVGSTDINRALLEAASLASPNRPTYLIFLTDGLPTEGETDSRRILDNLAAAAPQNLRLFAFGVGYDVDTFLLDSLAQAHSGTSSYVLPGERIDETVSTFYQKISTPVLTGLQLTIDGVAVFDSYPNPLPDLFAGSQIVAVGRYRQGGSADITLTGQVNGETQTFTFPDQPFATGLERRPETPALQTIPRLWATRKIGFLLNHIRLNGPDQETIDQIVALSIRYGIVTPYTSYLVTEEVALGEAAIEDLAAEEYESAVEMPPPTVSGQEAVEKAAEQGALQEADTAAPAPSAAAEQVRIVGDRTFVNLDGVWVDTAFDPGNMQPVPVAFLSDDYFALVDAHPELAAAFALGPRVIAFSEGTAYEVVAPDAAVEPIDIQPESSPTPDAGPATPDVGPATLGPTSLPVSDLPTDLPPDDAGPAGQPCLSGLVPLLVLPLLFAFRRRKPQDR